MKHNGNFTVRDGILQSENTRTIGEVRQIIKNTWDLVKPRVPKRHMTTRRDGYEPAQRGSREVVIRTEPVCWGIPMDEFMFGRWFSNFLDLGFMPWDDNVTNLNTYIPVARNTIHDAFLTGSRCDWLIGLDSDVLPPPRFIDMLLGTGKKFVSGWYKQKGKGMHPVVYDWLGDVSPGSDGKRYKIREEPGKGLEQVSAVGLGCFAMHREVAEKLGRSPYRMPFEGTDHTGEDLKLCDKLNELGIGVWVNWDIACAHTGLGVY